MLSQTKRYLVSVLVVLIVVAICGGVWLVYSACMIADHAERALHAVNLVTAVVEKYVQTNHRWPSSWDELKTVPSSIECASMYSFPNDWQKVQLYVSVDFKADPAVLASQSVEEFDAIKPIGPYYPYKQDGYVAELIETLRKTAGSQRQNVR